MIARDMYAHAAAVLVLVILTQSACQRKDSRESDGADKAHLTANRTSVRDELDGVLRLMARASEGETPGLRQQFCQILIDLRMASDEDEVGYIRDVIDFDVAAAVARNEKAGMVASLALDVASVSPGQILEALLPYLEKRDEATQSVVKRLLYVVEDSSSAGCSDFSHYQSYIAVTLHAKSALNHGLVEHMLSRSPGQALQTFTMVVYQDQRRKPLLWARHVVDDALWKRQYGFEPAKGPDAAVTEQLEKMAAREEWWARLYAAEVIRQHPEFGTDELAKRLSDDVNPLVQKTAKAIRPPIRN